MADLRNFRSAFRGFNREDVVRYIEYLNTKNATIVNQLQSENQALKDELAAIRAAKPDADKDYLIRQLQEQLAEATALQNAPETQELEAYRRAERVERAAKQRSEQICRQTAAALGEATTQIDGASDQLCTIADRVSQQIGELQAAIQGSKAALEAASAAMYAIHTEDTEE